MFAKKHPSRFNVKTKTSQFLLWIITHCSHAEKLEIYGFLKDFMDRYKAKKNKQKKLSLKNRKEKSVIKPTKGEKAGKKAGKNLSRKARRQIE